MAAEQGKHFCHCGCDQLIEIRDVHYPNPPRWIHGHNPAGSPRKERIQQPCACGCGELARPGSRFVYTHQLRGRVFTAETRQKLSDQKRGALNPRHGKPALNRKPKPAALPCACGCGALASPGREFITGHNGRGLRQSNYTGRYVSAFHGYAFVHRPDHPFAQKEWIAEHRIVMEEHLRQTGSALLAPLGANLYLPAAIVVHHINGVKDDNRLENLQALTNTEHTQLHHEQGDLTPHRH